MAAAAGTTGAEAPLKRKKRRVQKPANNRTGNKNGIIIGPFDLPFLVIVLILLVFGIIMMFSAGYAWAIHEEGGDGTSYVRHQTLMALVGLGCMIFVTCVDYHFYRKLWVVLGSFAGAIATCLLLFTPLGRVHNGAKRWLWVGFTEVQPSEVMKLAIIILFAYLISVNYNRMKPFKYGIVPFFIALAVVIGLLMLQPHLSCTILICVIGIIMIYVGGADFKKLLLIAGIGAIALVGIVIALIELKGVGYFQTRIEIWLDPFSDPTGDSWQTQNSLIAIGSGGLFGLGLGNSRQKFLYLPESKNDFVFAVVCEELGFIGAMMVIILFALFIFRGFYIASKAPDKFGMMLVVGVTIQIGLQAILNIAVVTNSIPNTGISLPFFSYGGTALIMQLAEMGIILNVSRQSAAPES